MSRTTEADLEPTTAVGVGAVRGTALFVAAIVGPGILTLPALAAAQAGPASLLVLGALLRSRRRSRFTFAGLNAAVPGGEGRRRLRRGGLRAARRAASSPPGSGTACPSGCPRWA